MIANLLLPEFAPPGCSCLNCKFYYRNMKRWDAPQIIQHYESEGKNITYAYGQKFCIKNKEFTYFNWYCVEWGK